MHYALYRKYRPTTFDDVVGQSHITEVLKGEVKNQKVGHSYLFTGSRGTGKTSCAKILAKAVNCLDIKDGNPCNACAHCIAMDQGNLLDVVEMDAASNSSVTDIREIIEQAVYTPAMAKYRVYIIDEVHMLSPSAFNALLKTMEEPPAHLIFILATTEIHKVLPTIISRCQRFDFRRILSEIIAKQLDWVCSKEEISITPEGAFAIALLADGGMRDALSILEVCSAKEQEITPELVQAAVGMLGYDQLIGLSELMIEGEIKSLLEQLDQLFYSNAEPTSLCDELLKHYRNLLLCKTIQDPSSLLSCLPGFLPQLKEQAKKLTLEQILESLGALMETKSVIARSASKRLELEIGLMKCTKATQPLEDSSLMGRIERLEHQLQGLLSEGIKTAPMAKPAYTTPVRRETLASAPSPKPSTMMASSPSPSPATVSAEVTPFQEWGKVLSALQKMNHAIASMLFGSSAFSDGRRILIDIQNPILLQMLKENDTTKNTIKRAILQTTGIQYGIGPYQRAVVVEKDPLTEFIAELPEDPRIVLESQEQ